MSVVSFIIQVQDKAAGPLAVIATTSDKARIAQTKLADSNKKLRSMMAGSSQSINDLNTKISKLQQYRDLLPAHEEAKIVGINTQLKKLNGELGRIQNMGGGKIKSLFKDVFNELPALAKNPLVLAGAGMAKAFSEGLKSGRDKLDLQMILGDKGGSQVHASAKKMSQYYGDGAVEGAKNLSNSGMGSGAVSNTIGRIGKVASGDASKFGALTGAFASLQREGKLTESTLEAMNDNGFKPLTLLQEKFGKSTEYWQKKLADGKLSIDDVNTALAQATDKGGVFADSLDRIDQSPIGAWDRMSAKATEFAGVVGETMLTVLQPAFDTISTLLDGAVQGFTWLKTAVEENQTPLTVIGTVILGVATAWGVYQAAVQLAWLWQMKDLVGTVILTAAKGAQAGVMGLLTGGWWALNAAMTANPIGIIIALVAGLVVGIMVAWNKFEGFRKVIYGLWETIKEVFNSIGDLFAKIFEPIGRGIDAIQRGDMGALASAAVDLMYNVSPVGLIDNLLGFAKEGGFDNVKGAYGRGEEKGAASWAADHPEDATKKHFNMQGDLLSQYLKKQDKPADKDAGMKDGVNAVSGGGAKVYNVTIHKMIETLTQYVSGGREAADNLEHEVEVALARVFQSLR